MDQAEEQSTTMDEAQQTAEQEPQQAEPQEEAQESETATEEKDSQPDVKSLGGMSADEQLAYLKKHGYLGNSDDETDEQPAEEQTETQHKDEDDAASAKAPAADDDPEYEITVDGKPLKVKLSELKQGYQRQADYTRKTQALADERREVDAMMAALKVKQGAEPKESEKKDNPKASVSDDYKAAVAQAERDLGIAPGEFNQFDPEHNFALQRVIVRNSQQQVSKNAVVDEVRNFVAEAQKDPLTPEIDKNFNVYLFELGRQSPEGAQKAMAIAEASQRLQNQQATLKDTKLLREHWNYVREQLTKKAQPQVQEKATPKPEPPKTETPGQTEGKSRAPFNPHKLSGLSTKQQIAALRRAGFM